jgi:magnesium transporter
MDFSTDTLREQQDVDDIHGLAAYLDSESTTWIDVQGLGDEQTLRLIGEIFSLHPLMLEDIVNIPQRPKIELGDDLDFIVIRMVNVTKLPDLDVEQVSLVVGASFVLSFQERHGDILDPVRARIRRGGGPIRKLGSGYLAYAIVDNVIDGYYPVLENLSEYIEQLEDRLIADPTSTDIGTINACKRSLLTLRRAAWPLRDALSGVIRSGSPRFPDNLDVYLRDCYDHSVQVIDIVETYREIAGGLIDVYLSSVSNRMNEVMKVLTVTATIFIPLSFIVGVYGMNFDIPEVHHPWGYPIVMSAMFLIAAGMFAYFRRRGWL